MANDDRVPTDTSYPMESPNRGEVRGKNLVPSGSTLILNAPTGKRIATRWVEVEDRMTWIVVFRWPLFEPDFRSIGDRRMVTWVFRGLQVEILSNDFVLKLVDRVILEFSRIRVKLSLSFRSIPDIHSLTKYQRVLQIDQILFNFNRQVTRQT